MSSRTGNNRRSQTQDDALELLDWLSHRPAGGGHIPALSAIGRLTRLGDGHRIDQLLRWLAEQGHIARRNGSRSINRGCQAIRIRETGRILTTPDCPFGPPE